MKTGQIIHQQLQKPYVWQFVKFALVGLSNAIVLLVVYYALIFLNIHYIPAYVAGFVLSVLNAYFWNNRFVFKNSQSSFWKKLSKVYVSYIRPSCSVLFCFISGWISFICLTKLLQ